MKSLKNIIRILFLGDIVGQPGRKTVKDFLGSFKELYKPDVVLANAENLAGSLGVSEETITEMMDAGIDAFTSGNHVWDKKPFIQHLVNNTFPIVRPANYPKVVPGREYYILEVKGHKPLLLVNLLGRVFIPDLVDCPFRKIDEILKKYERDDFSAIFIDFHAEATSEKLAMAHYLDGRTDVLLGTHTHVPTADARILDRGLGYVTDVGMVGPYKNSVIGADKDGVINYFLTGTKIERWEPGKSDTCFNAMYIEVDVEKKKTIKIERVDKIFPKV